jgi:enoyl-CoA hydratase/carnithine racemase
MVSGQILCERSDGILRLEICRPEKKNALTAPMYAALADALAQADGDAKVRVVLIHGQAAAFTAGNDLTEFSENPPLTADAPVFRFIHALRTLEKPLVAAVTGIAVGVGTTLLLHCDLAYCGRGARFQLPFVNLGLCPEAASSLLLPRIAGHVRAAEMLLLGEMFDAAKALEIGLVNEVLADEAVLPHARERAAQLVRQPAAAVRLTKRLLKAADAALTERTMNEEATQFKQRLNSPEAKEAFAAFLGKRKPDFSRFD